MCRLGAVLAGALVVLLAPALAGAQEPAAAPEMPALVQLEIQAAEEDIRKQRNGNSPPENPEV